MVTSGQPYEPFLQGTATVEILNGGDADDVRRALIAKVPQSEPFHHYPHEAVRLTVSGWRVTDVNNGWIPGRELNS